MNSVKDLPKQDIDDDEEEGVIPGTIFNERQARILKNAVIIMGVMLVAGFLLLFALLTRKAFKTETPEVAPAGVQVPLSGSSAPAATARPKPRADTQPTTEIKRLQTFIPKGASFVSGSLDGDRYIMTLQTIEKDLTVLFIDLQTWRLVAQAELKQAR